MVKRPSKHEHAASETGAVLPLPRLLYLHNSLTDSDHSVYILLLYHARFQVDHGASVLSSAPAALSAAAAAALGISAVLYHHLERRFIFTDYVHADK